MEGNEIKGICLSPADLGPNMFQPQHNYCFEFAFVGHFNGLPRFMSHDQNYYHCALPLSQNNLFQFDLELEFLPINFPLTSLHSDAPGWLLSVVQKTHDQVQAKALKLCRPDLKTIAWFMINPLCILPVCRVWHLHPSPEESHNWRSAQN